MSIMYCTYNSGGTGHTVGRPVKAHRKQAAGAEREVGGGGGAGGRVELQVVQRLDRVDDGGAGEPREARDHRVLELAGHHDAGALELLEHEAGHAALGEHHVGPQAQDTLHLVRQVLGLLRYECAYTYDSSTIKYEYVHRLDNKYSTVVSRE